MANKTAALLIGVDPSAVNAPGTGTQPLDTVLTNGSGSVNVNITGGGGGGGAVTIADGADVAEGSTTDAAVSTDTTGTVSGKLRGLVKIFANVWDSVNQWLQVKIGNATLASPLRIDPTGTTTQPVSGTVTVTPPANASTNITQIAGNAVDSDSGNKSAGTLRVVVATDQPQLTNALKVDGSGVIQPVSGTVTANAGTNLNTSLLALEGGGNLASINTKLPSQGQALAASCVPVVLPAAQIPLYSSCCYY